MSSPGGSLGHAVCYVSNGQGCEEGTQILKEISHEAGTALDASTCSLCSSRKTSKVSVITVNLYSSCLHLTNKEIEVQRSSGLTEVIQLVLGRKYIVTRSVQTDKTNHEALELHTPGATPALPGTNSVSW
jgi:hypothetical protein